MHGIGGGTVPDFVVALEEARGQNDQDLRPNNRKVPAGREDDPYDEEVFDETNVAIVMMLLNDYFGPKGKCIGDGTACRGAFVIWLPG